MSLFKVRLRAAWNWGGLTTRQLAVHTWEAMDKHDTLNQAAVVAYYAMVSLVPLLAFALTAALGVQRGVANEVLAQSERLLPPESYTLVHDQVHKIQTEAPIGLLSVSAVLLLWSASSLFVAVMDTTNAAYGVRDHRSWWKRRLMALLLTLIEVALLVGASASAIVWPMLSDWLGLDRFGWLASPAATVAQWLVVVIALLTAFALAYFFGPDVNNEWDWITPGTTLGVLVLIVASLGLRLYLHFGSSYSGT